MTLNRADIKQHIRKMTLKHADVETTLEKLKINKC